MTGILTIFIVTFSIGIQSSKFRTFLQMEDEYYENGLFYSLLLTIEKNSFLLRNRKKIKFNFAKTVYHNFWIGTNMESKSDILGASHGESGGAKIYLNGNILRGVFRSYVEGRRIKTDSIIDNSGYGFSYGVNRFYNHHKARMNLYLRKFGIFSVMTFAGGDRYIIKSNDATDIHADLDINLQHEILPLGLVATDKRSSQSARLYLSANKNDLSFNAHMSYEKNSSSQVMSMNYRKYFAHVEGNMVLYENQIIKGELGGNTGIKKKTLKSKGVEFLKDYVVQSGLRIYDALLNFKIGMRRYDYESLIPLDRDERTINISLKYSFFKVEYEKRDINYIKKQYSSSSLDDESFRIYSKVVIFDNPGLFFYYDGAIFAEISHPLYTNEKGFYNRFLENSFLLMSRDSAANISLTLKYKQIAEYKDDSIYNPVENYELNFKSSVLLVHKRKFDMNIYANGRVLKGGIVDEWRLSVGLKTGAYTLKAGIGELGKKDNSFVEFLTWI